MRYYDGSYALYILDVISIKSVTRSPCKHAYAPQDVGTRFNDGYSRSSPHDSRTDLIYQPRNGFVIVVFVTLHLCEINSV